MTDKEKIEMLSNGYGNEYIITLVDEAMGKTVRITMSELARLINRQKAENSNLTSDLTSLKNDLTSAKAEIERLTKCRKEEVEKLMTATDKVISEAKAEAYKECIEKVKTIVNEHLDYDGEVRYDAELICTLLDNLLKEKVGAEE